MIVGITGKKGSGKDTVGAHFKMQGYQQEAFAGVLKEAAKLIYRLTDEQVYGDVSVKETVDERWGLTPREILQKLGTEVARSIHPETWVQSLLMGLEDGSNYVVTDVRFLNEAQAIKEWDGVVIRVIRDKAQGSDEFAGHTSEMEQEAIEPDIVIYNNGGIADLWPVVQKIAHSFINGMELRPGVPVEFYTVPPE